MALGQFFSIDAVISATVLFAALVLIASGTHTGPTTLGDQALSEDVLSSLSAITVSQATIPIIVKLRANGTVLPQQMDRSVLEYVAELWAEGNTSLASAILENATANVKSVIGIEALINSQEIYSTLRANPDTISTSTRLISGINKSQPVRGYSARMQFAASNNRTTSTLAYFGGFIGQGNITTYLENLPSDLNASRIVDFRMEASVGSNFTLYVNGQYCGAFSAKPAEMTSQYFDLDPCKGLLTPGNDSISLKFAVLHNAYVGGGFIKVKYTTDIVNLPPIGTGIYRFPDINGIINIYDSLTIPGNLTSMKIHLNYDALLPPNATTTYFLTIGNRTVYNGTNVSSANVTLTDANLTSLNYSKLSGTVPIRMGLEGVNYSGYIIVQKPSDTVMVTDVSGSMTTCGDQLPPLTCQYGCTYRWWYWYFNTQKSCSVASASQCTGDVCGGSPTCASTYSHDACRERIDIAKEAAHTAAGIIFQSNVTRIGLDSFNSQIVSSLNLTKNATAVNNQIDGYTPGGSTCICCGIYKAYSFYTNFSQNRSFMILMSDGDANYACTGPGDYVGSSASTSVASQSAIDAGNYACSHNVSVYTVALGQNISANGIDTLRSIACNDSMFYDASNLSNLTNIYTHISEEILSKTTYTSQIVIPGRGMASNLSDSWISYTYNPVAAPPKVNEVPITVQTPTFSNCNSTFKFGTNMRVLDAETTSYSGKHWTSLVGINNKTVFNISRYGSDYRYLGDPFIVNIPSNDFLAGSNQIALLTGDRPGNQTGCSPNNSIVINAAVSVEPAVSIVTPKAVGCHWNVLQEDGNTYSINIPTGYNGTRVCTYQNASYDHNDAYDVAAYNLFRQLDVDKNGKIDIYLKEQDLSVEVAVTTDVPSLWGPSQFRVEVGR